MPASSDSEESCHGALDSSSSGSRARNNHLTITERMLVGKPDSVLNALAGAAGGFTSGVVTCPLDVIKTKLQAQGGFRIASTTTPGALVYSGMTGTAKVIWREEGLRGMYRGLGPYVLGYLPTWAVWFTVYGKSKEVLGPKIDNSIMLNFYSAVVAGACSTMATNPIWVIKTRLMAQTGPRSQVHRTPWYYKGTFDAARKMYRHEGLLSFYSGLSPALLGLTHVAIQFPAYEWLRAKFTGRPMGHQSDGHESSQFMGILTASILSKIMASTATYPHEVIRTRLQTQQRAMPSSSSEYAAFRRGLEGTKDKASIVGKITTVAPRYKGIITTFRTIYREEGWRAFYRGMGTNMMRAVPAATTTMLTYEYVIRQAHLIQASAKGKLDGVESGQI